MADWPEFEPTALLQRLVARGVDFVLIGGFAAVIHGSPRITQDIDIVFSTEAENLRVLGRVLQEVNASLYGVEGADAFVPDEALLGRVEILTLQTQLGKLDLLARPAGAPAYETLRRNARPFDLGEFAVPVASIEDLISMKQAAGRPKDQADVVELEAIRRLSRDRGRARTS